jgi:NAD(P)-dependent dehydrogenase (short-subunit alcohol dehydrogenase family)
MESKTVLITGAGGGLGEAMTLEFSQRGWRVIATDLGSVFTSGEESGSRIRKVVLDVSSDESVRKAFESLSGERLDLIVNNAGVDRYFPLSETPVEMFKELFEVNVFGSYRVNQLFLPILKRPGGRIIHISSESVKINVPFMTYPITKQTLEAYCRTLRQELRFLGIDVTVIRPGAIRTAFLENVKKMKNPVPNSLLSEPFNKFAVKAPVEIGRTVAPGEVARFVYRIAQYKKTKPVYPVNNDLRLSVAGWLPFTFLEKMVYKKLK